MMKMFRELYLKAIVSGKLFISFFVLFSVLLLETGNAMENPKSTRQGQPHKKASKPSITTTATQHISAISEEKLEEFLRKECEKAHPGSAKQQLDLRDFAVNEAMNRFKANSKKYSDKSEQEIKETLKAFMETKYKKKFESLMTTMQGGKKLKEIMDKKSKRTAFEKLKNLPPRQKAEEASEDQVPADEDQGEQQEDNKEANHNKSDEHVPFKSTAKGIPGLHVGEYKSPHDHFGGAYDDH